MQVIIATSPGKSKPIALAGQVAMNGQKNVILIAEYIPNNSTAKKFFSLHTIIYYRWKRPNRHEK